MLHGNNGGKIIVSIQENIENTISLICPGIFSMGIETVKTNMITITFLYYCITKNIHIQNNNI